MGGPWFFNSRDAALKFLMDRGFYVYVSNLGVEWVGEDDGARCRAYIGTWERGGVFVTVGA